MEKRRLFVALEIEGKVRDALWNFSEALKQLPVDASFVPKENLHVTVAFIGSVGAERAGSVAKSFSKFSFPPFEFSVRKAGAFPNLDSIRAAWAGCHSERGEFSSLHESVCNLVGIPPEAAFVPHVTLARVKTRRNAGSIRKFLLEHENDKFGSTSASTIALKASLLTPSGSKYENIVTRRFSGA